MKARALIFGAFGLATAIGVFLVGAGMLQAPGAKVAEADEPIRVQAITTSPGQPGTLPLTLTNDSETAVTYIVTVSVSAGDWGVVLCYGQACRIGAGTVSEQVEVEGGQALNVDAKVIPTQDARAGETAEVWLSATSEDGALVSEARGLITVLP